MLEGYPAVVEECDCGACEAGEAYGEVHAEHEEGAGCGIEDEDGGHCYFGSAFRDVEGTFACLGMAEENDGEAVEGSGEDEAQGNYGPAVYGHFTPESYYNKEVAYAGDDGKIAAVGVLQDFQFAFSGLVGRQGVHGAEESVHEGSAGEQEGNHYADYGTEEFIIEKVGMDYPPFGN